MIDDALQALQPHVDLIVDGLAKVPSQLLLRLLYLFSVRVIVVLLSSQCAFVAADVSTPRQLLLLVEVKLQGVRWFAHALEGNGAPVQLGRRKFDSLDWLAEERAAPIFTERGAKKISGQRAWPSFKSRNRILLNRRGYLVWSISN